MVWTLGDGKTHSSGVFEKTRTRNFYTILLFFLVVGASPRCSSCDDGNYGSTKSKHTHLEFSPQRSDFGGAYLVLYQISFPEVQTPVGKRPSQLISTLESPSLSRPLWLVLQLVARLTTLVHWGSKERACASEKWYISYKLSLASQILNPR